MEVRRRTRTAPATGQQAFAQAPVADTKAIERGLGQIESVINKTRRENQSFELQKRLLEENNVFAEEYNQLIRDSEIDPEELDRVVDERFTTRVNNVVDEYRKKGFDPDLVDQFFAGMGRLRNEFDDKASAKKLEILATKSISDTQKLIDEGSKSVVNNPDDYEPVSQFALDTIDRNPYLTEDQRIKLKDNVRPVLRFVAAQAAARGDPKFVLKFLDPNGVLIKDKPSAKVVEDASHKVVNYVAREATGVENVPESVRTLGDLYSFQRDLVRQNAAAGVPDKKNSSAIGVYQIVSTTLKRYAEKLFGDDWESQPFDFKRMDAIGRAIFEDHKNSAKKLRGQWVSLSLAEAERIRKQPWEEARVLIAKKESGADLSEQPIEAFDPGPSAAKQSEFNTTKNLPELPPEAPAYLRDLTGEERLRIIDLAKTVVNQQNAEVKAALKVQIENIKAEALANGEVATPIPSDEEIIGAFGEVAGEQIVADLKKTIEVGRNLKSFSTLSNEEIAARIAALQPVPGSETFATEQQLYEAAIKAQESVLKEREDDPAGYVQKHFPSVVKAAEKSPAAYIAAVDAALERLGFDPKTTSPFSKDQTEKIVKSWDSKTPTEKRKFFQDFFRQVGPQRMRDFARKARGSKLQEDLNIYALVRKDVPSHVVDEIFTGMEIMRKDSARRPSSSAIKDQINVSSSLGKAMTYMIPDVAASLRNAATAVYIARGGNASVFESDRYEEALRTVLGGGEIDGETITPRGVSADKFENWVERLTPEKLVELSRNRQPPVYGDLKTRASVDDIVDHGTFVMVAPGRYAIKMDLDNRLLKTSDGRVFIMNITPEVVR